MKKKKTIDKIIDMQKAIEKYGGDKLRAEIYYGMLRHWLDEMIKFHTWLDKKGEHKILKRFHKIVKIVGDDLFL